MRSDWPWFTLAIIVSVSAAFYVIVLPSPFACPRGPRIEGSAIGSLRTLSTAQEEFRVAKEVDQDHDGKGEYGTFQELAGTRAPRGAQRLLKQAYISLIYGDSAQANDGITEKSGYYFVLYLPISRSQVAEHERRFVIYAWPVEYGKTGKRVFAVNQTGEVFFARNKNGEYSGLLTVPRADAASFASFDGSPGGDGQRWETAGG